MIVHMIINQRCLDMVCVNEEKKEDQSRASGWREREESRSWGVPECALERQGVANQARPITQDQIGGALTNFVNIRLSIIGFFSIRVFKRGNLMT